MAKTLSMRFKDTPEDQAHARAIVEALRDVRWIIDSDRWYSYDELAEIGTVSRQKMYLIVTVPSEHREYWMEWVSDGRWQLSHTWRSYGLGEKESE